MKLEGYGNPIIGVNKTNRLKTHLLEKYFGSEIIDRLYGLRSHNVARIREKLPEPHPSTRRLYVYFVFLWTFYSATTINHVSRASA
jgi:hypothetical protein